MILAMWFAVVLLLSVGPSEVIGFNSKLHSPRSVLAPTPKRPYGCYAFTKEKEEIETEVVPQVNGDVNFANASLVDASLQSEDYNASQYPETVVSDIIEVMDEVSRRINDGSMELFDNITSIMDGQLGDQLPDSAATELSEYIIDITEKIQKAQEQELQRQLEGLEKRFIEPLEQIAFSDAPLFDMNQKRVKTRAEIEQEEAQRRRALQRELVLAGKNSTLPKSSRLKSSELLKNFNVAPLYFSAALLYRWARKASYPSVVLLSTLKGMASVVKTKGGPKKKQRNGDITYEEYIKDAEAMQSGWKKIGQIAAKGPVARKWAILRRSAEVWAYFSSFYLKDRRITRKYQSGRWSEERFKEERSKLGAEITQNLLRLGPTFIKVSTMEIIKCIRS